MKFTKPLVISLFYETCLYLVRILVSIVFMIRFHLACLGRHRENVPPSGTSNLPIHVRNFSYTFHLLFTRISLRHMSPRTVSLLHRTWQWGQYVSPLKRSSIRIWEHPRLPHKRLVYFLLSSIFLLDWLEPPFLSRRRLMAKVALMKRNDLSFWNFPLGRIL